jgi:endonuclease/exonuclease/phosphatase family metal-dependent hydrolase
MATYNIHSGVSADGRCDPSRIAAVIDELSADVVALQEVESHHSHLETLDFLAARTGMTAVAGPTLLRSAGDYGNALLTRAGLLDLRRIDLSVPGREPRGAIDAVVHAGRRRLRILATHLGRRLRRHFGETPAPATFPAGFPLFALDRLWVKPLRCLRAVAVHRSRLARVAWDHLPLTASLVLDGDDLN